MTRKKPKLWMDEFVGLSNRFEALPLAFAIQARFGHDIILDWRELDAFRVEGTHRGKMYPWSKCGAMRLRDCDQAGFDAIGQRNVICRSLDGPDLPLSHIYLDVAKKIRRIQG